MIYTKQEFSLRINPDISRHRIGSTDSRHNFQQAEIPKAHEVFASLRGA